jgi:hypothetical protein
VITREQEVEVVDVCYSDGGLWLWLETIDAL